MFRKILQFIIISAIYASNAHAQAVTLNVGQTIRNNESIYNPAHWLGWTVGSVTYTGINYSNGVATPLGDYASGTFGGAFESHGVAVGVSITWSVSISSTGEILLTYTPTVGIGGGTKTIRTMVYVTGLRG